MADPPTPSTQVILFPTPSPLPLPTSPFSSLNLSPIQYVFGLAALISIPALIYLFVFAIRRTSNYSSFAGMRPTRASLSSPPLVGSWSKSDFICRGKIVSSDTKCFEEEEEINDHECPVCLSGFNGKEAVKQLSVCKHAFHASCIDAWLDSNGNTCPICRAYIGHKKKAAKDPLPDASNMV